MPNSSNALENASAFFAALGVGDKERAFLERYAHHRYSVVEIPKKRGGTRVLIVPEKRLKYLQGRALELLTPLYKRREPVHGFVKGRGAISNARKHQGRPYLLNVDLKNFFGSISRRRVAGLLQALGLDEEVSSAICTLCTVANQLPQGAPTSPLLANMIAYRLDRELMTFAASHKLRYTRYADDLSFSSYVPPNALFNDAIPLPGRVPIDQLSVGIRVAIRGNDFEINPEKVWFAAQKTRKEVTGLTVNEFTNVKRHFIRNLRASLHKVETMKLSEAQKNFTGRYGSSASLQDVLRGRLEWIAQVRGRSFAPYRTLAKRYNKLFPDKPAPIDPTYEELADGATWVLDGSVSQGTAFFLRGVGLITADHVVGDLPVGGEAEIFHPRMPHKKFKVKVSQRRCPHRDLAILDHDVPQDDWFDVPVSAGPDKPLVRVLAVGYPSFGPGDTLGLREGQIVGRTTKSAVKLVEVSCVLGGGMSGGPVLNDRYEVVGVTHKGGLAEPKQLAIHISEVLALASQA